MKKGRKEKKMTEKEQEAQAPEEGGMLEITLQIVNMKEEEEEEEEALPQKLDTERKILAQTDEVGAQGPLVLKGPL